MRTTTDSTETARWISEHDPLPVVACDGPSREIVGFDPRSGYVETYWLAVLGPSSIVAVRRLSDWLEDQASGIEIALGDLAHSLGLGHGTSRSSPIVRTLDRLIMFDMARIEWDTYVLRRTIPPLSPRQQRRLPGYLAERHDDDLRVMAAETQLRS